MRSHNQKVLANAKRQPLSTIHSSNGASRRPSIIRPRLPATLPKHPLRSVDYAKVVASHPVLAGFSPAAIRKHLRERSAMLYSSLQKLRVAPISPKHLPSTIEVFPDPQNLANQPTRLIAVLSKAPNSSVRLYPVHDIVMEINCANVYSKPNTTAPSTPSTSGSVTIPVSPMYVQSPQHFSIILGYLYNHDAALLSQWLCPSSVPNQPKQELGHRLAVVGDVFRNAMHLGVVDPKFWEVLDNSWQTLHAAYEQAS